MLRLDPTLADIFNARGELWRKKGDRPRALADFGAALKLNPDHAAAKANYKSLALELERLGALMAVNDKPSFNCATARRAVEKAICANPELANLDREINAVNSRVVQRGHRDNPRAGRACSASRMNSLPRRNAGFGRPGYDLQKAMRERLDHLLAIERHYERFERSRSATRPPGGYRVRTFGRLRDRMTTLAASPRTRHFREPVMRSFFRRLPQPRCWPLPLLTSDRADAETASRRRRSPARP